MATVEILSYKVINACNNGLDWVKNYRKEKLAERVKQELSRTRWSYREWGRIPIHKTEEDVLVELKKPNEEDFFDGRSVYDRIMQASWQTEREYNILKEMAYKASTVTLSTKDYELIRAHL